MVAYLNEQYAYSVSSFLAEVAAIAVMLFMKLHVYEICEYINMCINFINKNNSL